MNRPHAGPADAGSACGPSVPAMDPWYKIGSALLLVMMIVLVWPRARQMLAQSRAAEERHWSAAALALALVALFVALLIWMVQ